LAENAYSGQRRPANWQRDAQSSLGLIPNFIKLPAFTEDGDVHVVIETPRGILPP
jgi:hypothetical protein